MVKISNLKREIKQYVRHFRFRDELQERIYENSIYSFVKNKSGKSRRELFEIVKKIDWFFNNESYDTVKREIIKLPKNEKYKYLKFKHEIDSSSNKFLSLLTAEGYINRKSIINITVRASSKPIKLNEKLIIIDDFIGTGNTVSRAMNYFSEGQKYILIAHSVTSQAIERFHKNKDIDFKLDNIIIVSGFKEKIIKTHQLNIINEMARAIEKEEFKYGYGNLGLLMAYEGIAPNNALPMLWFSNFNPPYQNWIPLFNRSINNQIIAKIKEGIFEDKKLLKEELETLSAFNISYREFLFLLSIRLNLNSLKELVKFLKFDTKKEIQTIVKGLKEKQYLIVSDLDFDISHILNEQISKIIKRMLKINGQKMGFQL